MASSTNNDGTITGGIIVSAVFLLVIGFFIFVPRWIGEKKDPQKSFHWEEVWLGKGPNFPARIRAFREHQRRRGRRQFWAIRVSGIVLLLYIILSLGNAYVSQYTVNDFWESTLHTVVLLLSPLVAIVVISSLVLFIYTNFRLWVVKSYAPIRIVNFSGNILKIYIQGNFVKELSSGAQFDNKKVLSIYDKYIINAKDVEGKTVYSSDLDLDALDNINWTIKIT
ncbi:MAG: hypothetical protein ACOWWR_01480 [Eubacteriales bacterium]